MKKTANILLFLYLIIISLNSCSDQNDNKNNNFTNPYNNNINDKRWVSADAGLNMRKDPDIDSEIIALIPHADVVIVLEERKEYVKIDKIKGKWIKIRYNGNIGWVFDGYLSKDRIISDKKPSEILRAEQLEELKIKLKRIFDKPVKGLEYNEISYSSGNTDYIDPAFNYDIIIISFNENEHTDIFGYEELEKWKIDYIKERNEYYKWPNGYEGINGHRTMWGGGKFIIKKIGNIKYEILDDYFFKPAGCFTREFIFFTEDRKISIRFTYSLLINDKSKYFELELELKKGNADIKYKEYGIIFYQLFEKFVKEIGNYLFDIIKDRYL